MIWVYGIFGGHIFTMESQWGSPFATPPWRRNRHRPREGRSRKRYCKPFGSNGPKIYWLVPIATGAQAGRPAQTRIPILRSAASKIFRSTYLVSMSAMFSVPKTLLRVMACDRILSCTHKSVTSKWRILPKPFLRAIPMAAVASEADVKMENPSRILKQTL